MRVPSLYESAAVFKQLLNGAPRGGGLGAVSQPGSSGDMGGFSLHWRTDAGYAVWVNAQGAWMAQLTHYRDQDMGYRVDSMVASLQSGIDAADAAALVQIQQDMLQQQAAAGAQQAADQAAAQQRAQADANAQQAAAQQATQNAAQQAAAQKAAQAAQQAATLQAQQTAAANAYAQQQQQIAAAQSAQQAAAQAAAQAQTQAQAQQAAIAAAQAAQALAQAQQLAAQAQATHASATQQLQQVPVVDDSGFQFVSTPAGGGFSTASLTTPLPGAFGLSPIMLGGIALLAILAIKK